MSKRKTFGSRAQAVLEEQIVDDLAFAATFATV